MSLLDIIRDRIKESGPISVAAYMELCLGHPEHGYYTRRDPFGVAGDFTTAPEISQIFGELLGLWCADMWAQSGGGPAALVELGPGRGTLMQDALRATQGLGEFQDHLTIHMVETSPTLQNVQYHRLRHEHARIEWIESVEQLPGKPLFVIANEFFDALPIRQHVQTEEGLKERLINWDEEKGGLVFVQEVSGPSLATGDGTIEVGTVMESCAVAKQIMHTLATHIKTHGGAAIIIDYGYLGEGHKDTLQAVKNHLFHPVLQEPGQADITAHVDFTSLMEVAADAGAGVHGLVEQGKFLTRLGAEMRAHKLLQSATEDQATQIISGLKRLIDPAQMGDLFKVMAVTADKQMVPAGF